jgi:hypothetical protein
MQTTQEKRSQLSTERTKLVVEKQQIQAKLTAIKNLVRSSGRMPHEKYRQCCEAQTNYLKQLSEIEQRFAAANDQLTQLAVEMSAPKSPEEKKSRNWDSPTVITELCSLRQEYQEFSADGSRISSKRQMASEFVLKLNGIIKRAMSPQQ